MNDVAVCARGDAVKLDPREEHLRVPSPHPGLSLFLRHQPSSRKAPSPGEAVLYVHGGTFPSALSIAHRFDGYSWCDALCDAGFHVWGLDFHGFGLSDHYSEMDRPAKAHPPLGRAAECSRQLEAAVRFICGHSRVPHVSLIAHSWGTIVAGEFAARRPNLSVGSCFSARSPAARRSASASGCQAGG